MYIACRIFVSAHITVLQMKCFFCLSESYANIYTGLSFLRRMRFLYSRGPSLQPWAPECVGKFVLLTRKNYGHVEICIELSQHDGAELRAAGCLIRDRAPKITSPDLGPTSWTSLHVWGPFSWYPQILEDYMEEVRRDKIMRGEVSLLGVMQVSALGHDI